MKIRQPTKQTKNRQQTRTDEESTTNETDNVLVRNVNWVVILKTVTVILLAWRLTSASVCVYLHSVESAMASGGG